MLQRIRWGSIVTVLFILGAVFAVSMGEIAMGVVLGLCAIAMAILSLKETL